MNKAFEFLGKGLARYLSKEIEINATAPPCDPARLKATLKPCDVLLVEGNTRFSTPIKYLTQSTWSHAALYVGDYLLDQGGNPDHYFIDADTVHGVRTTGFGQFSKLHTRICRPVGLTESDVVKVLSYASAKIGDQYDLRNLLDLARYLLPTPPVPTKYRRKLLALGSGSPTQAICSTLIAQAFQSVHYPILAMDKSSPEEALDPKTFHTKHFSLFTPRDFDVSPYFQIIKPTVEAGFDFHNLEWVT